MSKSNDRTRFYITEKMLKDNKWIEHHKELRQQFRYFVRGDGIKPFYSNEPAEVLAKELAGIYLEIIDWRWDSDKWNEDPYKVRHTSVGDVLEFFAHEGTTYDYLLYNRPTGVRVNGAKWEELYYRDSAGDYDTSFLWTSDGHCSVIHAGKSLTRMPGGIWYWRVAGKFVELDGAPLDDLLPQARRINAEKWRGFYRPIIDFLIKEGLNGTQI